MLRRMGAVAGSAISQLPPLSIRDEIVEALDMRQR